MFRPSLRAAAALAVLVAALPTRAQEPDQASGASLIRVDVVVTGVDGTPVRGLTRDDFDLLVGGERRVITTFREAEFEPPVDAWAKLPADVSHPVGSNALAREPRVVVLVLPDRTDAAVRRAAVDLLAALETDVVVGVAFAGGAPGVELTRDRVRLRDVLARPAAATGARAAASPWPGLTRAASALTDRARRRRAFVIVGGAAGPSEDERGAFLTAARDGGVSVYTYGQAAGGPAVTDLVRDTGGYQLPDDPAEAAAGLIGDLGHHYLLSVDARPGERVEALAEVAVHVAREGAVVRPRLGHDDTPAPAVAPDASELARYDLGIVAPAGVSLRAVATPFPADGRDLPVAVSFEMSVPRAPLEALGPLMTDEVEWTLEALDLTTGRVTSRRGREETRALRPRGTSATRHDVVQYEVGTWIDLRPGRYQLRLAATSRALEVGGAVFLSLDVPSPGEAPIQVGGVVFGFPPEAADETGTQVRVAGSVFSGELAGRLGGAASTVTVVSGGDGRMPIRPAIGRDFDRWEELRVFFEVRRRGARPEAAALVEVTDALGRPVYRAEPSLGTDERARVQLELPLVTFVPGAYRLAIRVPDAEGPVLQQSAFVVSGVPPSPDALAALTPTVATPALAQPPPSPDPPADAPPPADAVAASAVPEGPVRLQPDLNASDPRASAEAANRLAVDGWERYQQGDVEGAQARLTEAIALGNDSAQVHYALGLSEFALGRYQQAAAAFEFARQRQPDHQPVYFDLTDAYRALGRSGDALAVLRDAAGRWPNDPEVYNATGLVLFNRGDLDDAIGALQKATTVAPREGLGFFNLARTYHARMLRWQRERSVQSLSAARALADRDRQRAIDAYTKALELGGSFDEWDAREALRVLSGGRFSAGPR